MNVVIRAEGFTSEHAEVTLENGDKLDHVTEVVIRLTPAAVTTAQLTFLRPTVDVVAKATVSFAHLRDLAADHGFTLVPKEAA